MLLGGLITLMVLVAPICPHPYYLNPQQHASFVLLAAGIPLQIAAIRILPCFGDILQTTYALVS